MEALTNATAEVLLGKPSADGELAEPLLDGVPPLLATGRLVEEAEALDSHLRAGHHPGHLPGVLPLPTAGAPGRIPESQLELGRLGQEAPGGAPRRRIGRRRRVRSRLDLVAMNHDALQLMRRVVTEGDIHAAARWSHSLFGVW